MSFTYISKSTFTIFLTIFFLFIIIGVLPLIFLTLLIFGLVLFLFRKKKPAILEDQLTTRGIIYSPVNGKVKEVVKEDGKFSVVIETGIFDEYGIYLPTSSEIRNLIFDKDYFVYRIRSQSKLPDKGVWVELKDKLDNKIELQFLRFFTGRLPELVILPGDRGARQANVGYFPFGGLSRVQLADNFNCEINVGDKVVATETILARLNEV